MDGLIAGNRGMKTTSKDARLMAGSRGGKTTSKDGRAYRWQWRWDDNIQGWTGLSLALEVGRQHTRMDGFIADSRGGKTTSKDGRAYRWQ